MRFHIGCSFRPKNILKFIFPFLLGLLAMFGIEKVSALSTNFDSKYNLQIGNYEEKFSTNLPGLNYSFSTLDTYLSSFSIDNNTFGYFSYITDNDNDYTTYRFIYFTSTSCPFTEHYFDFVGQAPTGVTYSIYSYLFNQTNNNGCRFRIATFYYNPSRQQDNITNFNSIISNLSHVNSLNYTSTSSSFSGYDYDTRFNNIDTFTLEPSSFLYNTNTTLILKYQSGGGTGNDLFYKTLNINGQDIEDNSLLPTYVQLLNQQGVLNDYLVKLPYNYFALNKSDISSFNAKYTYFPNKNASEYLDMISSDNLIFYGRYNHNNDYYTYELINCSLTQSTSFNVNSNKITTNYNNLTCTSDLTNYDKIYIFESFKYDSVYYGRTDISIYNSSLTSNVDSFSSSDYLGNLYEPLLLNNGFKLLVSGNSQNQLKYISSNDYVSVNKLSNEDISNIENTLNGVEIGYDHIKNGGRLPIFHSANYGSYDQSMYYFYDNYTLHENMTTELKLFFDNPLSTMVSFPVVVSGQDTFSYYNNEGTISNSTTIKTNYGDIGGNYNKNIVKDSSLFDYINNFLDSIEEDLISFHDITQTIFDNIPNFIQAFILVLYSMFLLGIIFKELRK